MAQGEPSEETDNSVERFPNDDIKYDEDDDVLDDVEGREGEIRVDTHGRCSGPSPCSAVMRFLFEIAPRVLVRTETQNRPTSFCGHRCPAQKMCPVFCLYSDTMASQGCVGGRYFR